MVPAGSCWFLLVPLRPQVRSDLLYHPHIYNYLLIRLITDALHHCWMVIIVILKGGGAFYTTEFNATVKIS